MGRKRALRQRMERAMDFPGGSLSNTALLEIEGDRRVVIAGCQGILTYTDDCICLRTPEGQIAFFGQELEMGCLSVDGATVTGRLQRIEFGR